MRSSNPQTPSSFEVLTPTRFLDRAAAVFADRLAIVDGERRFTYAEFHDRALRLTGVLAGLGVGAGDRVAVLCSNSHTMLELHIAIPLRAAVMVPLNTRLSEPELKYIIEHSGTRLSGSGSGSRRAGRRSRGADARGHTGDAVDR
jgi:fatty-acyl-CoA synthase